MKKTHIWTTWSGQKIPIDLMKKDHIKSTYRLCVMAVYVAQERRAVERRDKILRPMTEEEMDNYLKVMDINVNFSVAERWIPILEAEAAKRKFAMRKPDKDTIWRDIELRRGRRAFRRESNDNFDKPFK